MKFSRLVVAIGLVLNLLAVQLAGAADLSQKVYTEGFLWGLPPIPEWVAAFDQGLTEPGWIQGQHILERLPVTAMPIGCLRSLPSSSKGRWL